MPQIFAWNADFDLAALFIFALMLFLMLAERDSVSWKSRIFLKTLYVCIAAAAAELFLSFFCAVGGVPGIVLSILIILSELLLTAVMLMFCVNLFSMTMTKQIVRRKWFWLLTIPFFLSAAYLLIFGPSAFTVRTDERGTFILSAFPWLLPAVRLFYAAVGLVFAVRCFRQLNFLQRISGAFFTVLVTASVLFSLLTDYRVFTLFSMALTAVLMFMTLQNPLAYRDPYIRTDNEWAFRETAKSLIGDGKQFTVIVIHPEGFTGISGAIGRENGDRVLRSIAGYLISIVRDGCVFHLNGTKFAVLLPGDADPTDMAMSIRNRFLSPFMAGSLEVPLTAVITCLRYPQDVSSMDDLSQSIEYALQAEVQNTESRVFYGKEFTGRMERRDEIAQIMRRAIDSGQIEVFYQPIYSSEEGRYISAEALARLPDEKGGYIPPGEFIPIAEQQGDILKLGEMVLQKVCGFISMSRPQEHGIRTIHVNLSAVQCMQERMANRLISIIDAGQVPHSMITFEVTESIAAVSSDMTGELIGRMRARGVQFALDDYGTGYSNVQNLMAYDYSVVKIDKSLVWASGSQEKSMTALRYIMQLIHELHMEPLAEGIETQEQADRMEKLGCRHFQGFLYSMPVPGGKFMQIVCDREAAGQKTEAKQDG